MDIDDVITAKIIAMEKAALDRWGQGDPSGFLEICAPDVVYFDPFIPLHNNGPKDVRTRVCHSNDPFQ